MQTVFAANGTDNRPAYLTDSLWDRRMLRGTIPYRIRSDFPDIGRGNVDHDAISHENVERGLSRSLRIPLFSRVLAFFDL